MRANLVSNEESTKKVGCNLNNLRDLFNPNYKIDSLRIYIPIDEVTIHDDYFGSYCVKVNANTGQVQDSSEAKLESTLRDYTHPNIRTDFGIDRRFKFNFKDGVYSANLVVFVNAKQLKEKYLKGVNRDTIRDIYDFIMSLNAVTFSYESFLNANILDVDFCKDFISTNSESHVKDRENLYNRLVNGLGGRFEGVVGLYETTSLYYNRIRERATNDAPHLVLYDKTAELRGYRESDKGIKQVRDNIGTFYLEYLIHTKVDELINKGIIRLECTLRNASSFDKFGLKGVRTLKDLMEVEELTFDRACKSMFNQYYNHITAVKATTETETEGMGKLTPSELVIVSFAKCLMRDNPSYNKEDLLRDITADIRQYKGKSMLSRKRSEIKDLIAEYVDNKSVETLRENTQKDSRLIDIFKTIGLYD